MDILEDMREECSKVTCCPNGTPKKPYPWDTQMRSRLHAVLKEQVARCCRRSLSASPGIFQLQGSASCRAHHNAVLC